MMWYGLRFLRSPRSGLALDFLILIATTAVLLLPWMWQQYVSGGSPLYPFLGQGNHLSLSKLDIFGDSIKSKLRTAILFMPHGVVSPAIVSLLLLLRRPLNDDLARWQAMTASVGAAVAFSFIIPYQLGAGELNSVIRYCQPILYSALISAGLWGFFTGRPLTRGLALCLAVIHRKSMDGCREHVAERP